MFYIEPIWRVEAYQLKIALRHAQGNIDQYEARIYAFETSPTGVYPLFNHYFSGMRNYVYISKKMEGY